MIDKILSLDALDEVRMEEYLHDVRLQRTLKHYGINYKPVNYRQFGMRLRDK
ncbi:MAG: hypothetical protein LBO69_06680 [Ignavibacteria bacterium]|jgi:hypothetical protein|nr:hypothetical protein [Ignavibacteria bacterium]